MTKWSDVPLAYLGDEDGWRKWCAYADAASRVMYARSPGAVVSVSSDRSWWAERDMARKRLEYLRHNGG